MVPEMAGGSGHCLSIFLPGELVLQTGTPLRKFVRSANWLHQQDTSTHHEEKKRFDSGLDVVTDEHIPLENPMIMGLFFCHQIIIHIFRDRSGDCRIFGMRCDWNGGFIIRLTGRTGCFWYRVIIGMVQAGV